MDVKLMMMMMMIETAWKFWNKVQVYIFNKLRYFHVCLPGLPPGILVTIYLKHLLPGPDKFQNRSGTSSSHKVPRH